MYPFTNINGLDSFHEDLKNIKRNHRKKILTIGSQLFVCLFSFRVHVIG